MADIFPFVFRIVAYVVLTLGAKRAGILTAEEMGEMVLVSGLFLGLCGTSCTKEEQPNQTERNPRDLVHGRLLLAMLDRFSSKNAPQGEFISTRRAVGSLGVAPHP